MDLVGVDGQDVIANNCEISQLSNFDGTPDIILMVLPGAVDSVRTDGLFHIDTLFLADDFSGGFIFSQYRGLYTLSPVRISHRSIGTVGYPDSFIKQRFQRPMVSSLFSHRLYRPSDCRWSILWPIARWRRCCVWPYVRYNPRRHIIRMDGIMPGIPGIFRLSSDIPVDAGIDAPVAGNVNTNLETSGVGILDHADQHVVTFIVGFAIYEQLTVTSADIVFIHEGSF